MAVAPTNTPDPSQGQDDTLRNLAIGGAVVGTGAAIPPVRRLAVGTGRAALGPFMGWAAYEMTMDSAGQWNVMAGGPGLERNAEFARHWDDTYGRDKLEVWALHRSLLLENVSTTAFILPAAHQSVSSSAWLLDQAGTRFGGRLYSHATYTGARAFAPIAESGAGRVAGSVLKTVGGRMVGGVASVGISAGETGTGLIVGDEDLAGRGLSGLAGAGAGCAAGAAVGLIGGPLAPITSTGGCLVGAMFGGLGGGLAHDFSPAVRNPTNGAARSMMEFGSEENAPQRRQMLAGAVAISPQLRGAVAAWTGIGDRIGGKYDSAIRGQLDTLETKGWMNFKYTGSNGREANLFDRNGDGNLTLSEIKTALRSTGVKLSDYAGDDGKLSGKELTNAMTAAIRNSRARLDRD